MLHVDLGFADKTDSWLLKSNYFPSKIGGKPSWLNLSEIPSYDDVVCSKCNKPMIFLCQIYAPIEGKESCFHRSIFIFVCRNESCSLSNNSSNFLVWRSQLSRKNDFYSFDPPVESSEDDFAIENKIKVCSVCGIGASKHCSKCKIANYCCREHQIYDWKSGHKQICCSDEKPKSARLLFDEWEILIEKERDETTKTDETSCEAKQMEEYEKLLKSGEAGTMPDVSETELDKYTSINDDKTFFRFRKRISKAPDQILRYDRGGQPLWVADNPKPVEIPNCEYCNSPRQFEFQILPQMLHVLKENSIDWGTLAVFTCNNSCDQSPNYKKEFVFKQDFS